MGLSVVRTVMVEWTWIGGVLRTVMVEWTEVSEANG